MAANFNSSAQTVTSVISVFSDNAGSPGTLLGSAQTDPQTLAAGSAMILTFTGTTAVFTTPAGVFWVGISFTDGGTGSLTTTALNNIGLGLFNPPTTGSSQDLFFSSSSSYTGGSDPAGSTFFFGGSPTANFGIALGSSLSPTPEPSSLALLALGLFAIGAFAMKQRRTA